MTVSEEKDQEPPSLSEIAENEPSSERQHETTETGPEVVEGYKAWLYVLTSFITYINVS